MINNKLRKAFRTMGSALICAFIAVSFPFGAYALSTGKGTAQDYPPETGVFLSIWPYLTIIVIAVLLIIIFAVSRKKKTHSGFAASKGKHGKGKEYRGL